MSEGPSSFRLRLREPTPVSPSVLAPVCPDPAPAWHPATLALAAGRSERPACSWPWGRTSPSGSAEQEPSRGVSERASRFCPVGQHLTLREE